MAKLTDEEREKIVEKLEEAIKALETLGNRVSEKAKEIEKPNQF